MRMEQAIAALRFDPLLPAWLLAALGRRCALAAVGSALWRRARGTVLARCFAFAVAAAVAGRAAAGRGNPRNAARYRAAGGRPDRLDAVGDRAALAEAARAPHRGTGRARCPTSNCAPSPCRRPATEGTRLFAAIDRALADIPRARLAGMVAITDGQVHDVRRSQPVPAARRCTCCSPASGEETDRRLRVIEAPGYGIVGKSVTLRVAVDDLGRDRPRPAARHRLTIRRDGAAAAGRKRADRGRARASRCRSPAPARRWSSWPPVRCPARSPQLNNRAVVEINGVRDRLRVLLVSGEPHPGERTWRRLLKADPSVDLVHFTILRPPEKDDLTPLNELALIAFPVRELFQVKIGEFDLIILDRFQNRGLLPLPYLAQHRRPRAPAAARC